MKTILRLITIILLFSSQLIDAQIQLETVNVSNTSKAQSESEIRYYYFPNLLAYYDTQTEMYIYKQDGEWVISEIMDTNYRGYSQNNYLYVAIKGYTGDEPYLFINEHKQKYPANFSSRPTRPVASAY